MPSHRTIVLSTALCAVLALALCAEAAVAEPTITSVTITTSSTDGAGAAAAGAGAGAGVGAAKGRTFWPAFVSSLIVIILAELGDKTFFIAAVRGSTSSAPRTVAAAHCTAVTDCCRCVWGGGVGWCRVVHRSVR